MALKHSRCFLCKILRLCQSEINEQFVEFGGFDFETNRCGKANGIPWCSPEKMKNRLGSPAHFQGCQMSGQQLLTSSPINGSIEGSMSCEIDPPQELWKIRSLVVLQGFKLGAFLATNQPKWGFDSWLNFSFLKSEADPNVAIWMEQRLTIRGVWVPFFRQTHLFELKSYTWDGFHFLIVNLAWIRHLYHTWEDHRMGTWSNEQRVGGVNIRLWLCKSQWNPSKMLEHFQLSNNFR